MYFQAHNTLQFKSLVLTVKFLSFRDTSTQTSNSIESSIEILKDAIKHPSSRTISKDGLNDLENHINHQWTLQHHPFQQSYSSRSLTSNLGCHNSLSSLKGDYNKHESPKAFLNMIPIALPAPLLNRGVSVVPIHETRMYQNGVKWENSYYRTNEVHSNNIFTSCIVEKILDYNPQDHNCVLKACQVSLKGFDGITRSSKIDFCEGKSCVSLTKYNS